MHGADSVVVVCGDRDQRAGVARLLRRAGYAVTESSSGEEALAEPTCPLAVIVDAALTDVHAFEMCCELRDRHGDDLPIILFTADRFRADDRVAALLIGADDYLPAPLNGGELLARLRRLLRRSGAPISSPPEAVGALTPREREVLALLAQGANANAIARELVISGKTVASHLQRVMGKLNVHSRAQVVAEAYRLGVVPNESGRSSAAAGG